MWRLGDHLVVRVPRTEGAAASLAQEAGALGAVAPLVPVAVPRLVHFGEPAAAYPYPWAVLSWLDGRDAWDARHDLDRDDVGLADDLADVVLALRGHLPSMCPFGARVSAGVQSKACCSAPTPGSTARPVPCPGGWMPVP